MRIWCIVLVHVAVSIFKLLVMFHVLRCIVARYGATHVLLLRFRLCHIFNF